MESSSDAKQPFKNRQPYVHDGKKIYEWEQNMNEVLIYITPPEGVKPNMIDCKITPSRLKIGLKGNPPFIDEDFFDLIVEEESMWTMSDNEIEINLQKMRKASTWDCCLKGHKSLNAFEKNEIQKQMTLERFQEEHAGFDFRDADFNGAPPDPRTFLGGVPYK